MFVKKQTVSASFSPSPFIDQVFTVYPPSASTVLCAGLVTVCR